MSKPIYAVEWHTGDDVWDAFAWFATLFETEEYIRKVWPYEHTAKEFRIVSLEGAGND